jgi:hypothetical protein
VPPGRRVQGRAAGGTPPALRFTDLKVEWWEDSHLTGGSSARIWNATTGQATGMVFVLLPNGELAVYNALENRVIGCTENAWRWLGWNVIRDGRMDRLPAETFGPLPLFNTL